MANRVVLGALPGGGQGLRISRPGANVLSTSLAENQVSFDSRWPQLGRIILRGGVTIPSGQTSVTVNYGVTLPVIPTVFALALGSGEYRAISVSEAFWDDLGNEPNALGGAMVYTNRVVFTAGPVIRYLVVAK
jgi:hypothetical protein